jgi:hypothetical protein
MVGPPSNVSWATQRALRCRNRAATTRRVDMFENAEKNGSGRTMKIIWIVLAVAAVILAIVSFA